jgi:hypothetical protein
MLSSKMIVKLLDMPTHCQKLFILTSVITVPVLENIVYHT